MRQLKRKSVTKKRNIFREFTQKTTIHGLEYVNEPDLSYGERFWWLAVIIISVTMCTYLINETYNKWQRNPLLVTLNDKSIPVQNVRIFSEPLTHCTIEIFSI